MVKGCQWGLLYKVPTYIAQAIAVPGDLTKLNTEDARYIPNRREYVSVFLVMDLEEAFHPSIASRGIIEGGNLFVGLEN